MVDAPSGICDRRASDGRFRLCLAVPRKNVGSQLTYFAQAAFFDDDDLVIVTSNIAPWTENVKDMTNVNLRSPRCLYLLTFGSGNPSLLYLFGMDRIGVIVLSCFFLRNVRS